MNLLYFLSMQINSGVYAVILNEKKEVLLIHRPDHDIWEIPGGRWEDHETPWEAVVREVEEETGLKVEVEKITSLGSRPSRQDLVFTFLCRIVDGTMHPTAEADQIRYFPFEAFPSNIAPSKVARVKDALAKMDACFLRDIDKAQTTEAYMAEKGL